MEKKVGVIILAAGGSRRLGRSKLLLRLPNGKYLFRHIVDIVAETSLEPVIIVMGEDSSALRSEIQQSERMITIENTNWKKGMSSSLKLGISAIQNASCHACVIVLADQPFLSSSLIDQLVKVYHETGAEIVYPSVNGRRANPVLLDQVTFPGVMSLKGDVGARQIFNQYSARTIPWQDEKLLLDIDTEEDFQAILSIMNRNS